jgi:ubiquinone/menaquinone biosynthesis C-methylase UbiE
MTLYVHGYSGNEAARLADQADTLAERLHANVRFPKGYLILEPGCGVGAQTFHLAKNNPETRFLAFDFSAESIKHAKKNQIKHHLPNVQLDIANIYDLPYAEESFDGAFVCFLLEHLHDPVLALQNLRKAIKPDSPITVIEGDHGSYLCHPRSEAADHVVGCLVAIQAQKHGNALIGRSLYPLLDSADFREIQVVPQMIYVDAARPDLAEGFTRRTFIAMVEGVKIEALQLGLSTEKAWEQGIQDLHRTTHGNGTFCYTFFKAVAIK